MKRIILVWFLFVPVLVQAQLAVGTTRKNVATDTNGWVVNNPVGFSNQVTMVVAATNSSQLVRFGEFTNTVYGVTNKTIIITFGGTGTNTTLLPGSWTNSINFTVGGTNNANAYRVGGTLGISRSITNMAGSGVSNVHVYSSGILTNTFTIP